MRSSLFLLFCFVLVAVSKENVELDLSSWDALREGSWLLKLHTETCGYCQRIKGSWEGELVSKAQKLGINVASIDVGAQPALGEVFRISHVPSIRFIKDSAVYAYEGEQSVDSWIEFAKGGYKDVEPPSSFLTNPLSQFWRIAIVPIGWIVTLLDLLTSYGLSYYQQLGVVAGGAVVFGLVLTTVLGCIFPSGSAQEVAAAPAKRKKKSKKE